jgi:thioesterase domain-containing protein
MTEGELETYLHDHIPLSRAMEVRVVSIATDRVVLGAPLLPNINHRETVFGGSAASIATLAAWSLLHVRLTQAGLPSRIVIQRSTMEYLLPIAGDFSASAALGQGAQWERFIRMLARKGIGRIELSAALTYNGAQAGVFRGEFVTFGADRS